MKSNNEIFSNDKLLPRENSFHLKELPNSAITHISFEETSIISFSHSIDKPKLNYQGFQH